MPNPNHNRENLVNCIYYDNSQVKNLKACRDNKSLSLFHLNKCSFSKTFDDFQLVIQSTNIDHVIVVIAISKSRIIKNKPSLADINLPNYSYKFCLTESSAGGTLLCLRNQLLCKVRKDLSFYKSCEFESICIDVNNPKRNKIVIECIYKHPAIDHNEFNEFYLKSLFDKLSEENKTVPLLADFNINLNYDQDTSTNEFLSSLSSHLFLTHILQRTIVRSSSKTLIDNIFSPTSISHSP